MSDIRHKAWGAGRIPLPPTTYYENVARIQSESCPTIIYTICPIAMYIYYEHQHHRPYPFKQFIDYTLCAVDGVYGIEASESIL